MDHTDVIFYYNKQTQCAEWGRGPLGLADVWFACVCLLCALPLAPLLVHMSRIFTIDVMTILDNGCVWKTDNLSDYNNEYLRWCKQTNVSRSLVPQVQGQLEV